MAIRLKPVGDNFLLVPDEAASMTDGKHGSSLHIPDQAKEKPKTGKVIAVGDGLYNTLRGEYIGMPVIEGDRVVYKPFAGLEVTLGDATALLLKAEDIMAIIEQVGDDVANES